MSEATGFLSGPAHQHQSDLGVDRSGRANDVRVLHARVALHGAVLHVEAAVERELGLLDRSGLQLDRTQGGLRVGDGLDDARGQLGRIVDRFARIAAVLGHGSIVIEVAKLPAIQRAGVAVRGRHDDVRRRDAGLFRRRLPRPSAQVQPDADEVAEDDRDLLLALFQHDRLGQQGVMRAGAEPLHVVAAHPIRHGRRDVDDGDARLDRLGRNPVRPDDRHRQNARQHRK